MHWFYVGLMSKITVKYSCRDLDFQVDGLKQRWKLWAKGLWWLYGYKGVFPHLIPAYLAYYRPGFHPRDHGDLDIYHHWRRAYEANGHDAIAAGDAVIALTTA